MVSYLNRCVAFFGGLRFSFALRVAKTGPHPLQTMKKQRKNDQKTVKFRVSVEKTFGREGNEKAYRHDEMLEIDCDFFLPSVDSASDFFEWSDRSCRRARCRTNCPS
jgi:hypothetical protein